MELYHKQLKSVADLKREKKRLKIAHKVAENNADAVRDAKNADNPIADYASIIGDIVTSKGGLNTLMSIGMPLFNVAIKKAQKGFLKKVGKELIGGYLKWKAIDTGVTLAMRFIRMQKHKVDKD